MPAKQPPRHVGRTAATAFLNDEVITKLIAIAATCVSRHAGYRRDDRADLRQDIRRHLVEQLPAFAVTRGDRRAWAKAVITNYARTLLRRRWAQKRNPRREQWLTDRLAATLTGPLEPDDDRVDFAIDLEFVLRLLPPNLERLARQLQREPLAPAARTLGISRDRARKQLAELRAIFERAGLAAYR